MRRSLASIAVVLTIIAPVPLAAQTSGDVLVPLAWLRAHLEDPRVAIVHVGDAAAFAAGHIPGAGTIEHSATLAQDHRLLEARALADVLSRAGADDGKRIVLYGREPMAVAWVFSAIASIGHGDHVALLDGNLTSWTAAGYPVATSKSEPRGRLSVHPTPPDFIVDAAWVRDRLADPRIALVDVRSEREWQQGVIAGSRPLLWRELFEDLPGGKFKRPDAIRQVFERAGVTQGRTAVTYCAVGMRASLAYVATCAAGIPARVYLGSWSDWTRRTGYPIDARR